MPPPPPERGRQRRKTLKKMKEAQRIYDRYDKKLRDAPASRNQELRRARKRELDKLGDAHAKGGGRGCGVAVGGVIGSAIVAVLKARGII